MISPDTFGYNNETAASNAFQKTPAFDANTLRKKVSEEFKAMVKKLIANGIDVFVAGIDSEDDLPDAVFPNNWFATYEDGSVILFPMLSANRRKERDKTLIEDFADMAEVTISKYIDLSEYENENRILEGTGSLVLDRKHNAVFAIESERTSSFLFDKYCSIMNVSPENRIFFHAEDEKGNPIYHTNVIMSIGDGFAVICEDCIMQAERKEVLGKLSELGLEVIKISYAQMNNFCGNILNVKSNKGESIIVMSATARWNFEDTQIQQLEKYGRIIEVNIATIEQVGGGSARCMMAEIFLPGK
jgi:hypothetical protein